MSHHPPVAPSTTPQPLGRPRRIRRRLGPGFLITAAFIGPGTVTTAATAGFQAAYQLLWVVVLSTIVAIVLQEMAGRLGLVLQESLGQVLREQLTWRLVRWPILGLVFVAILFGNAAYQGGNLLGAVKGLDLVLSGAILTQATVALGCLLGVAALAALLLGSGNPQVVRGALVGLVVVMSGLFLVLVALIRPPTESLLAGLIPSLPQADSAAMTLGLFGTTIVPYNLFLYTSLLAQQSRRESQTPGSPDLWPLLRASRLDIVLAVGLGGIVTAAILVTGAAAGAASPTDAALDLAHLPQQLSHLLDPRLTRILLGLGLMAAGLTSAITAPLAAAYAAAGLFGWRDDPGSGRFRSVWILVLLLGLLASGASQLAGFSATQAILLAQAANGLVLPVIAYLLWWLVSRKSLLGVYANGKSLQVLSFAVVSGLSLAWLVSVGWKIVGQLSN